MEDRVEVKATIFFDLCKDLFWKNDWALADPFTLENVSVDSIIG